MKRFKVGSNVFFSNFPDYVQHDQDYIIFDKIEDNFKYKYKIKNDQKIDLFIYNIKLTKKKFIELKLNAEPNSLIDDMGALFVPDIQKHFNITIRDIKKLLNDERFKSKMKTLCNRWAYYKVILNAYLENNSLEITDKQLKDAYVIYKLYRTLYN